MVSLMNHTVCNLNVSRQNGETCRRHVDWRVAGGADALCGAGHDDRAGQEGGVPARPRHDLLHAEYHIRRVRVLLAQH